MLGAHGRLFTDPEDPRPEMGNALLEGRSPELGGVRPHRPPFAGPPSSGRELPAPVRVCRAKQGSSDMDRPFKLCLLSAVGLMAGLVAGPTCAGQALDYMPLFPEQELGKRHVHAPSRFVGHDFVDGQWQGIIAASDGSTYFSVSSHSPRHNAQFYRYVPKTDTLEHLADVGVWCGYADSPGRWNAQGKIHSNIYEHKGTLYCTTTSSHATFEHPYPGGHFLAYDLRTGRRVSLGKVDFKGRGGLLSAVLDPSHERLYAIHQHRTTLCYCDLKTRKITVVGPIEDGGMQCRSLIADPRGVVYGSTRGGMIYRYDPETDATGCLLTRIPHDPDARQPPPSSNPKDLGWQTTHWTPMVWDPQTKWWYGVRGNDEYLFRFRPPGTPRRHIAAIEGLAPFGFRPSAQGQPRFASLGMALLGRRLYYCSYPLWRSMAHLMSYEIDTGTVTNHGPIATTGRRRVSEIHAMVAGSDGALHCAAMVWSIEGRDPAKPWANRAQCYFHARFMTIDPSKHLKNQDAP